MKLFTRREPESITLGELLERLRTPMTKVELAGCFPQMQYMQRQMNGIADLIDRCHPNTTLEEMPTDTVLAPQVVRAYDKFRKWYNRRYRDYPLR